MTKNLNTFKMSPKKKTAEPAVPVEDDVSMGEAPDAEAQTPDVEDDLTIGEQRIRIVSFLFPS